ncbi:MAG TPA: NO-inducible flavohemoprotein, partial [Erwinia persicina]|nr:NO-inducible flavohemoprotein [Erwinia persicina]
GAELPQFWQHIWYNHPQEQDKGRYDSRGLMNLLPLESRLSDPAMQYYLCGPLAFMELIEKRLLELGVTQDRIHYEVFGPHKTL